MQVLGQPRPRLRLQPRHAVGRPARGGARRHPPRHRRQARHPALRRRPQELRGQEAVRGRDRQPQPPHAPDRERVDARGARQATSRSPPVRGLPRRPPQARGAGGQDRRRGHLDRPPAARSADALAWFTDARRQAQRPAEARSPSASSRRSSSGSASSTMSGSTISTSIAPAARCRGGESQRIRLASQIGSGLSGVLYVLDEPSRSASTSATTTACSRRSSACATSATPCSSSSMTRTRSAPPTMSIDMGPGAGVHGGEIVCQGTLDERPRLPGQHHRRLSHRPPRGPAPAPSAARATASSSPSTAPPPTTSSGVTAAIPLGTFTCVTGVSGIGQVDASPSTRSTPRAARALNGARILAGEHDSDHRPRTSRQGDRHRPVADRPHPALQPRDLHRRLHPDPRLVRRPARKPGARLQARPLQLQRQGRPLRGVPGRRRCSRSRCTSCPTSTSPATSATARATTARRWR